MLRSAADSRQRGGQQQQQTNFCHGTNVIGIASEASLHDIAVASSMPDTPKYLKGQLLLDSGQLRGSFFQRSVVLICQHDAEGAFGLVLNRATGSKVGEMVVADLPDTLKDCPLFLGGPVQPTALSFLHTDAFIPDANVLPNLSLGHSLDALVELG